MSARSVFGAAEAAAWLPSERDLARSRLARAMRRWNVGTLGELHRASVDDPAMSLKRPILRDWIERSARIVADYYGRFPALPTVGIALACALGALAGGFAVFTRLEPRHIHHL